MSLCKHFAAVSAGLVLTGSLAFAQPQPNSETIATTSTTESVGRIDWKNPHLPHGVLAGGGLAYAALLGLMFARGRERGVKQAAVLHLGAAAAFGMGALNLTKETRPSAVIPNEVVVLVDRSPSQSLGDRTAQTDAALSALLDKISIIPDLIVHTVPVAGTSSGTTNLFDSALQTLRTIAPERRAGVFAITDGQVHDIPEQAQTIFGQDSKLPFHVLVTGAEKETDRRVLVESASRFTAEGSEQSITLRVMEDGIGSGDARIPVQVMLGGDIVAETRIRPGQAQTVRFTLPRMGTHHLMVTTPVRSGEVTHDNNRQIVTMDVARAESNILLFSSTLTRNTQLLRSGLLEDADANLTHYPILRPPGKQDTTPLKDLATISLPLQEVFGAKLSEFNTMIIDQYRDDGLVHPQYFENLARRIESGGSALILVGPEFADRNNLAGTPLGRLLPLLPKTPEGGAVLRQTFRPSLSETGARHPILRGLQDSSSSWGPWYQQADVTLAPSIPGRQVIPLLNGVAGTPLMALAKVGDREKGGRIVMIASDQIFLWANGHRGGGPAAKILFNTMQWLAKHPDYDEESITLHPGPDQSLSMEVQTMNATPPAFSIRLPSGAEQTVRPQSLGPGQWRSTIPAKTHGLYTVTPVDRSMAAAAIQMGPSQTPEMAQTVSTLDLLRPVVDSQGGTIARITMENGKAQLPEIVPAGTDRPGMNILTSRDKRMAAMTRGPLLPPWIWMGLGIGFLGLAWARESGMMRSEMLRALKPGKAPANGGPAP